MADLQFWRQTAGKCGGQVVTWINQTEALRGSDSEGVCDAITRDWVDSFKSLRARGAFFGKFWRTDQNGQLLDHFVPADYVARQQELRDKKRRQQQWLAMFNRIAADYEKKFPNDKATIKQADEERIRLENQMRGGSDCKTYFDYGSLDDLKDGLRLLNNMPGGYILHMLKDGRGHAIAFEILLGKEKGEGHPKNTSYPGFCQFLDPNTGWSAFENSTDFMRFSRPRRQYSTNQKPTNTTSSMCMGASGRCDDAQARRNEFA